LQIIAQICALFNTLVPPTKFSLRKLETPFYRTVQNAFRYLEPFRRGLRVYECDGRTDGQKEPPLAIARFNDPR